MNLKDIKIDKGTVIKFGKKAGQVSKVIVMNGIKATLINGATKYISTTFDDGPSGAKKLTFDDLVGIKEKEDKPKKRKLFSKKDEAEELIEQAATIMAEDTVKAVEAELIDKD